MRGELQICESRGKAKRDIVFADSEPANHPSSCYRHGATVPLPRPATQLPARQSAFLYSAITSFLQQTTGLLFVLPPALSFAFSNPLHSHHIRTPKKHTPRASSTTPIRVCFTHIAIQICPSTLTISWKDPMRNLKYRSYIPISLIQLADDV